MGASWLAPLVAWLAHESCDVSGECFAVGAGHVARVGFSVNGGYTDRDLTPELVAEHEAAITALPTLPLSGPDSPLMSALMEGYTDR